MSEAAPEAPVETPDVSDAEAAKPAEDKPAEDSTDWKAEARKWEQRAKENRTAAKELEAQRQATMSESERAVAEAEARGRNSAATEFGKRLAKTEFDALAGRRNPELSSKELAGILDYVDLARFVGDDGEPDMAALKAAVERLVPSAANKPTPMDLGARKNPPAGQDFNQQLRAAAGRV